MDTIKHFGDMIAYAWDYLNTPITMSGITFTFADIAEVAVFVAVVAIVINGFTGGEF